MKNRKPYISLPAHVYLPALASVYIAFFLCGTLAIALILPILFFLLEASAIVVDLFAGEKNSKRAVIQFIILLVVLSPIIIATWLHWHR
jgi:hypothetical protein